MGKRPLGKSPASSSRHGPLKSGIEDGCLYAGVGEDWSIAFIRILRGFFLCSEKVVRASVSL